MTVVASNYARKGNDLTALRDALAYDPATGIFVWRIDRALKRAGDRAGNIGIGGYRRITVDYQFYYEHHLAIAFETGSFPGLGTHVDHINGKKTDNRLINLRVVSPSVNGLNRTKLNKNNGSGAAGVYEIKPGRFIAFLTVKRRRKHLGTFDTFAEAVACREAALAEAKP